jgi:hypothetical protein
MYLYKIYNTINQYDTFTDNVLFQINILCSFTHTGILMCIVNFVASYNIENIYSRLYIKTKVYFVNSYKILLHVLLLSFVNDLF